MSHPVAETASGTVQGVRVDGAAAFKGIPYAGRVSGDGRFRRAPAAQPWGGLREAAGYGPAAPQPKRPPAPFAGGLSTPAQAEDCLVLNVWTPSTAGSRPVLVWLHGGAFSTGSGSAAWTDGSRLAAGGDVVVVTVNHRLGLLGFLDVGALNDDYVEASNVGMLDLVAALGWVAENIASFGGDASRVTIFGESGGGAKVAALLAMPAARGLFHRAIIQSGVFLHGPGELLQSRQRAAGVAEQAARRLGGLDGLRRAPVAAIVEAQRDIEDAHRPGSGGIMPFCPVVDGRIVVDHPASAVAAGAAAEIPLIIGSNLDESSFFLWAADARFRERPATWDLPDDALEQRLRGYAGPGVAELVAAYRDIRPGDSNRELFIAVSSDNMRMGALRFAEAKHAGGSAPVHVYLFAWRSPFAEGALGAAHTFEIPFVFDTVPDELACGDPVVDGLAREIGGAWSSFAAGGSPVIDGVGAWLPYRPEARDTVVFGPQTAIVRDPYSRERLAWTEAARYAYA